MQGVAEPHGLLRCKACGDIVDPAPREVVDHTWAAFFLRDNCGRREPQRGEVGKLKVLEDGNVTSLYLFY